MILALDVGNSQLYGGIFNDQEELVTTFRKSSREGCSSDELGLFLRGVLRENKLGDESLRHIAICSVVPDLMHSLKNCCIKYFGMNPFILQAGVKTGLKIKYRNPHEVGADRIANAIGATLRFPNQNLIIIDYGTATTFCAITAQKDYLGGVILPGFRIAMESLESNTSKLPSVEILKPEELIARSTTESIQSGLYFGNLAIVQTLVPRIKTEYFANEPTTVIGTGGFSRLFEDEGCFDYLVPDLVLHGLKEALKLNS